MLHRILLTVSFLAVLLNTGCRPDARETVTGAFIGGRILNPNSNQVIILKDNIVLDTIDLNQQNKFSYRLEHAEPGLYLFKHSPETHVFHLEPGDSLLLRANTLDFDESLHFSGTGGEKNNFLSDLTLLDSKNTELLFSYHKINPAEFARKSDSIKDHRLDLLFRRNERYDFSDDFLEIAKKTINYGNYDLRERYTYMVNKYFKEHARQIPEDFHNYRKHLNFNETRLQTSPTYIRFLENYLINDAMKDCAEANIDKNNCYDLYDHKNITTRIHTINTLTSLPLVKNHFFAKYSVLGIIMARERDEITDILEIMKEKGYSEEKMEKLTDVGRIQLSYLPGRNIGNVQLINTAGERLEYEDISNKPAVIFLWSVYSPANHQQNHRTIKGLRKKYPEVDFIGINVDPGEIDPWIKVINNFGYDPDYEFQLYSSQIDKETFQYYLNKVLLVHETGEVYKGDAYINSPEFETRVLELLNQ